MQDIAGRILNKCLGKNIKSDNIGKNSRLDLSRDLLTCKHCGCACDIYGHCDDCEAEKK
jgi:hypothetical protein